MQFSVDDLLSLLKLTNEFSLMSDYLLETKFLVRNFSIEINQDSLESLSCLLSHARPMLIIFLSKLHMKHQDEHAA
ncbi:CLUMA_CG021669, isoform A [Clunio marinus]|uniref:CLUMA_CG021669, isoform A n=1 Tax=Clunio marinus TaxID=568069 RepID=A0A1J1JA69_9DIPT|nr:CLUMA_CG021669, isoform A [Clunio marinus]